LAKKKKSSPSPGGGSAASADTIPPNPAHHMLGKRRGKIVAGKPGEAAKLEPGKTANPVFTDEDAAKIAADLDVWWVDGSGDKYLVRDGDTYATWSERKLLKLLRLLPGRLLAQRPRDDERVSETDRVLLHIMQKRKVMVEFPALAGHRAGVHKMAGGDCLVKTSPNIIEPKEGDFDVISELIETRFGPDAAPYFHGWLRVAYRTLLQGSPGNFDQGHAVVLAGRAGAGKTFLQKFLITPMLGGRSADPESYLFGRTDFNAEMIGAEHLMMSDPANSIKTVDRVYLGEMIKRIVANPDARLHRKSIDGIMGEPFWRLTISINDDPDKLRVLPLMTPDFADKIMIFDLASGPMPMPTKTPEDKALFRETITNQLPGYAHWLLNEFKLPEELEEDNPRFGLKFYHAPELRQSLFEDTPASDFLNLIDAADFTTDEPGEKYKLWELPKSDGVNVSERADVWLGFAIELEDLLLADGNQASDHGYRCSVARECQKLFKYNDVKRLLGRLAEDRSDRVTPYRWTSAKSGRRDKRGWLIGAG